MQSNFPKSVFGFYFKHTVQNYFWLVFVWLVIFFSGRTVWYVIKPLCYKWFTALFEVAPSAGFMEHAFPTIALIFGLHLYASVNWVADYWLWGYIRFKLCNSLSNRLYDYIYDQSMDFFKNAEPGKVTSQIEKASRRYPEVLRNGANILGALIVFAISSGIIFQINLMIAWVLIAAIVARIILSIAAMPNLVRTVNKTSEAQNNLNGKLLDGLANFIVVKMFAGKKHEMDFVRGFRARHVAAGLRSRAAYRWQWCPPMFTDTAALAFLMLLCVKAYQAGTMNAPEIVFAFASYIVFTDLAAQLTDWIPEFADAAGEAAQSYRTLIKPITVQDAPDAKDLVVKHGKIEIQDLSFGFHKRPVLHGLNITIEPGEKLGIVGASGAGKTTLINLLMRFFDPQEGRILIDGQDIKTVTQDSLREHISFIPQEPTMFNRSLHDNIGYGQPQATKAQIRAAARQSDADQFIMETPEGYDSLVGDRGIKLSGGQRQRIAIARALLKDAPILILDEATSALDSETELVVQKSFKELSQGRTTIVIAHRLSTLRNMDRIIVLDKGRIVEDGTHAALLRKKESLYAHLWHMQLDGFIQG